jgi:hypothetical protein
VPWVWYLCLNARRHRMKLLLVVALMMAGVYFCMNRSGWGGLLASMIVMALFVPRLSPHLFGVAGDGRSGGRRVWGHHPDQ